MTENDTFNKLRRLSFDEIMRAMLGSQTDDRYYHWIMADMVKFNLVAPKSEFWQKHGYGWDWEEFRQECQRRV